EEQPDVVEHRRLQRMSETEAMRIADAPANPRVDDARSADGQSDRSSHRQPAQRRDEAATGRGDIGDVDRLSNDIAHAGIGFDSDIVARLSPNSVPHPCTP